MCSSDLAWIGTRLVIFAIAYNTTLVKKSELPSTYEGFGMVVLEAMTQRLPVIATPVGAARSLIVDGRSGLLVPPRDGAALADAIGRLMNDASLRLRLAEGAFERVSGMTWTATARHTLEVYARARASKGLGQAAN